MDSLDLKISNDNILKQFKDHLEEHTNERILLSGPFGSGKSTFINEFEEFNNEEYYFIKLYPVNYSVSSNEDIFELIKFDILFELLSKYTAEIKLEKEDFTFWLRSWMYITNRMDLFPIFHSLLSLHDKIGKPAAEFLKIMKETVSDFKSYSEEVKIDELQDISDFMDQIIDQKGSPFEMDSTSKFIYDIINNRLKARSKKVVLIIDDLDRLDPDHIFRLFNIFSAHTNSITGENKFGFDKVVFICDIENIRKIYKHKYGSGVDFEGYIDKFYSSTPFTFNNFNSISDKIYNYIEQIEVSGCDPEYIKSDWFRISIKSLLKILLLHKKISLREIACKNRFFIEKHTFFPHPNNFISNQFEAFVLLSVVKDYVNGWNNLFEIFKEIKENNDHILYTKNHLGENRLLLTDLDLNYLIGSLFVFIILNPEKEISRSDFDSEYKNLYIKEYNLTFRYSLIRSNYSLSSYVYRIFKADLNRDENPNIYDFIFKALENLKKFDFY
ncbi:P-loop NTPase fold protein [Empedobacter tilapiae]|uniref:AAA+ ATPase domain-containing protein n=1 Tax=Empedobacter tilapiae TaxID=2491114 RepID=A0A4Z1BTB0_9FLAO|nr:P-loop NTPase fold protein [Empedobacter tilapiae]TGN29180.1 hypothetical protein E4J94_04290 [Empedobacter tilapiae]